MICEYCNWCGERRHQVSSVISPRQWMNVLTELSISLSSTWRLKKTSTFICFTMRFNIWGKLFFRNVQNTNLTRYWVFWVISGLASSKPFPLPPSSESKATKQEKHKQLISLSLNWGQKIWMSTPSLRTFTLKVKVTCSLSVLFSVWALTLFCGEFHNSRAEIFRSHCV